MSEPITVIEACQPLMRMFCSVCKCSVGYTHAYRTPKTVCHECVRSGRYQRPNIARPSLHDGHPDWSE